MNAVEKRAAWAVRREQREADEIAYGLWLLCWRIKAVMYGDTPNHLPEDHR